MIGFLFSNWSIIKKNVEYKWAKALNWCIKTDKQMIRTNVMFQNMPAGCITQTFSLNWLKAYGSRTVLRLTFHNAHLHISVLQHPVHYSAVAACDVVLLITLSVCWCRGMGYVPAGEGFECTVTVDDEDSKVIIFDNWKQVSSWPSAPQSLCLVYRVQFRPTPRLFVLWWPLALLKSHLTFFAFDILCVYLRNGKSNLFNSCDGQVICVHSSVECVFRLLLLCVLFICVLCCAGSPARESCAHCTF